MTNSEQRVARRKTEPRLTDRTFLLNHYMSGQIRNEVERTFPLGWKGRVLDVGCGHMPYRSLFDGRCAEYLGCDEFPAAEGVVRCPAQELAFPDHSFDAVVCFQVLEHVTEPWLVVPELARVVKPGGIVLITVPFVFPHHSSPHDFYRYTHEGLRFLAERSGMSVERMSAQCNSLSTLCLLLNWYNGCLVQGPLAKRRWLRPLAWLNQSVVTVPLNIGGMLAEKLPVLGDFRKGNTGVSNYLLLARTPLHGAP